jgi:hypothetical protein
MATAERKPIILPSPSGKIEPESSMSDKIAEVLQLVQKEGPLSKKQARDYYYRTSYYQSCLGRRSPLTAESRLL